MSLTHYYDARKAIQDRTLGIICRNPDMIKKADDELSDVVRRYLGLD